MTFDIKRRLKLLFRPDAHTAALEREAWRVLATEARKVQAALSIEIEDEGFEAVVRRIIEIGSPIEHDPLRCRGATLQVRLGPACGRSRGLGLRACNSGKVLVNKAPDGHASPNRADGVMIAFAPVSRGMHFLGVFGSDGFTPADPRIWG